MEKEEFRVSLFANVHDKNPQVTQLETYIERVMNDPKWKQMTENYRTLRAEGQTEEAALVKRRMEAITPAGVFDGGHKASQLSSPSGLTSLDLDGTDERTEEISGLLHALPYVRACHRSISGAGIKVFVHISIGDAAAYPGIFEAVRRTVESAVNFRCDATCKDICRLCYASHDPEAYYNPDSRPFDQETDYSPETPTDSNRFDSETLFEKAMKAVNRKMLYTKGNRNNYLFTLLCHLNRQGMSQTEAESNCLNAFDLPGEELENIVRSAYSHAEQHNREKNENQRKDYRLRLSALRLDNGICYLGNQLRQSKDAYG